MSSIRQQIAENRVLIARQMKQGAGYNYDWASFYDGPAPPEPDEVPAFSYIDPSDALSEVVFPLHSRTLFSEAHGTHFAPEDADQYPAGRRMIADLERNLKSDITTGDLSTDVRILRSEIFAGYPAHDRVTVVVAFETYYRTHAEDPNRSE